VIHLAHCSIQWTGFGCTTRMTAGGEEISAWPHRDDPHYYVIAHRCGYGDNILAYCREHEFAHAFIAEKIAGAPSVVLTWTAKLAPLDKATALFEEMAAQTFQRFLRANERPILAGADWDGLKAEALQLLAGEGD
jgi:hypothetical protein